VISWFTGGYRSVVTDADLNALVDLMPPPGDAGDDIDWPAADAQLGTPLPADYRAYIGVYGAGSVGGYLSILLPVPVQGPVWTQPGIADETGNLRLTRRHATDVPDGELSPASLLCWGVGSANPDLLGWVMTDVDPDRWPVLVRPRHVQPNAPTWLRYDCGMVTFLVRLLRGEFDRCPLSDAALWGHPAPYVHWRLQQQRFQDGLDPITGEPDPYADMFRR
jgi:hypothetical protein